MTNEFAKAADILAGVKAFEERLRKYVERKCDWEIPEDVANYKRSKRFAKRATLLPVNRLCPCCGECRPNPRQWIVVAGETAVCRSCWQRVGGVAGEVQFELQIVGEPVVRYPVVGLALRTVREGLCLSKREFARRMGWSAAYQLKLESEQVTVVREEVARKLLEVVKTAGGITHDSL